MLMSVDELRKDKKSNDPDYVLPNAFLDPKQRAKSTPDLCSDKKEKEKSSTLPITKEVGGQLYAIANPNTRDKDLYYQSCRTQY